MIEVKHLNKKIGTRQILNDVNLTIQRGSIYGIIGVNGAGKTTLIRHLIGSYIPDSGEVLYEGKPIFENNELKSRVVYIPDEFPTTFGSNIREIANFYSHLYPSWSEVRYQQLISRFKQNELTNFNQFSKGMKKQVLFILALSIMPDYLITDEPFDGLDPLISKTIWEILIHDVTERNMTLFISSHHLKELDAMCDTICLLDQGKVLFEYKMEELKNHIHKFQIAFHSEMMEEKAKADVGVIHEEVRGKIRTWIIEGNENQIIETLEKSHPLIIESLPLDLEEIFTFALGGERHVIEELFGQLD